MIPLLYGYTRCLLVFRCVLEIRGKRRMRAVQTPWVSRPCGMNLIFRLAPYPCAFSCDVWWSTPRQVLGHLGFDFEDEGVPLQPETDADGKRSPANDNSRGKSRFLSWGGTSSMSFQVGRALLVVWPHDQTIFVACVVRTDWGAW